MLTILVGMSGSGKDAIQKELVSEFDFERIVTTTTRPMREGEQNGVDYHFISRDEFMNGINNNDFIEYRSYDTLVGGEADTWYYGSPKQELEPDKDYCIILDIQGAKDFVEYYGKENCFVVEIIVKDEIREERASARGSFDKTEWDRRLADDKVKFAPSETESVVNCAVDNSYNDLEDTVFAITEAYDAYHSFERKEGKHYIVEEVLLNGGYYDPPESEFRVFDANDINAVETRGHKNTQAERE